MTWQTFCRADKCTTLRTSQSFFLPFTLHLHCQTLISSYFPPALLPQTFPHRPPNRAILHLGARQTQNDPRFLPSCLDKYLDTVQKENSLAYLPFSPQPFFPPNFCPSHTSLAVKTSLFFFFFAFPASSCPGDLASFSMTRVLFFIVWLRNIHARNEVKQPNINSGGEGREKATDRLSICAETLDPSLPHTGCQVFDLDSCF